MKKIAVIVGLVVVAWAAWPYVTFYRIASAIDARDAAALERHVAWDPVRQGIKEDLRVVLNRSRPGAPGANPGNNPLSDLAALLLPAVLDTAIDAAITPSGLVTLLPDKKLDLDNVKFAFFTGLTSFRVELVDPETADDARLKIVMRFQGLGWKITRIFLPVDKLLDLNRRMGSRTGPRPRRHAEIRPTGDPCCSRPQVWHLHRRPPA